MISKLLKEISDQSFDETMCTAVVFLQKIDMCYEALEKIVTDCTPYNDDLAGEQHY